MPDLTLAVAQSLPIPGDLGESVRSHLRLASLAAEHGARLVLFPELSLTGYNRGLTLTDAVADSDPGLRPLQVLADTRNLLIVAGAPIALRDRLHIGALSFVPGSGVRTYLKEFLHEGEEVAFAPGPGGDALTLEDEVVGMAICADITHPEHARAAANRGATIYATSCFITEPGYQADTDLLRQYAREHRMVVLMANYGAPSGGWGSAGRSAIWSESGELLACAPSAGEALIAARIASRQPHHSRIA